jgi:hypothetical protein
VLYHLCMTFHVIFGYLERMALFYVVCKKFYVLFENCLMLSSIEYETLSVHLNGEITIRENDKRAYKKDNYIHVFIEELQY